VEEFHQIKCWDDQAPIDRNSQNLSPVAGDVSLNVMVASNISRNKQRNAETSVHVSSEAAPTEFVENQRHRDIGSQR